MTILNFLINWWEVIVVAIILLIGIVLRLKSLWKGNIIEWLIDICADMEKEFGSGTGFLKLRGAYSSFISAFPVVSKIITFDTFSSLVDIALEKLKDKINTNEQIKTYVSNCTGYLESGIGNIISSTEQEE